MKKILSMFLAIIMLASLFAVCAVPVAAATEETRADVCFSTVQFSAEQATWILYETETAGRFRVKNKATGLFLTMESDEAGNYSLFQAEDRGIKHNTQWFQFAKQGDYLVIYNVPLNRAIYSSTSGDSILFKDASDWWHAPEGAGSSNCCQFYHGKAPAVGDEIVMKMASANRYLQSPVKTAPENEGTVAFSTTQSSTEHSTWTLEAVTGGYRLKNKATALYLTMEKDGDSYKLVQTPERGLNPTQIFTFHRVSSWQGNDYYIIQNTAFKMVIYSNDAANQVLFASYNVWNNPPEGASDNNRAQFIAVVADKADLVIRMAGGGAYLQSKEYSVPDYTADAIFSTTQYSADRSTWILHAASNGYRLENKATGLYLTMEKDGESYKVYQASNRGASNVTQLFAFMRTSGSTGNSYFMLYNIDLNRTIYSNATCDGMVYQSASNWWTVPEGASANSACQFNATVDPADGVEYVIKMAGGGAYLQSAVGSVNEKSDAACISKAKTSDANATWILHSATNGFKLENKATGLYLTMDKDGDSFKTSQVSDRGNDATQIFAFTSYNTHYFIRNVAFNTVIYSSTNGDAILYQSNDNWWTAPEGASGNALCQFQLNAAPADSNEETIRFASSAAYLRAQNEIVDVTVTADGNGTVTDITKAEVGTSITVSAVANDGYAFTGWYVGGELVSADAQYTFTVSDATALTAKFVAYGDNDLDGEITLDDLIAIRKSIINKADYSIGCDANADSEIDIRDLVAVKKLLSNIA